MDDRALIARLRAGQPVWVRALGGSMWPAVRDGALVRVVPRPAAALAAGELCAYAGDGDRLVIHRVTAPLSNGVVRCRGDSLDTADPPVAADRILGLATVEGQRRLRLRLPRAGELRGLWRWLGRG
jgi:hypothetical protein